MTSTSLRGRPRANPVEPIEFVQLRQEFKSARRQLDSNIGDQKCSIGGCRTMPYVALRTQAGRRALCLSHFDRLQVTPRAS